uniref:Uncharacterized protein n=1 Tax=viral metagenome TaxID=1070528 RepID=A0A6C0DPR8_9ZZZZ
MYKLDKKCSIFYLNISNVYQSSPNYYSEMTQNMDR